MLSSKIILPFLVILISVLVVYFKPSYLENLKSSFNSKEEERVTKDRLFTLEELSLYDGSSNSPGLYLALLGKVFDVEKGVQHYKPGAGYSFFTGKDATRAYVTGEFTKEGLVDSVEGLDDDALLSIDDWIKFYQSDYTYVGKLISTYYDNKGEATQKLIDAKESIRQARRKKDIEKLESTNFPSCNSEWNHDTGGRVWCTKKSGGIDRDWIGVPRQLYSPNSKNVRCVCVRTEGAPILDQESESNQGDLDHPNLIVYPNCDPAATTCKLDKL